jgi:hypothetical protein
MTIGQAEDIVRQVGSVIADRPFDDDHWLCWARPLTDLPCSIGKAKYAFFKYAEHLVEKNLFLEVTAIVGSPITDTMIIVYGELCTVFREDAQEVNEALYRLGKNTKKYSQEDLNKVAETLAKKFGLNDIYSSPSTTEAIVEFNNFLADMQNNYFPSEFKESDHPYLAYSGSLERKKYHGVSKLAWDKETNERPGLEGQSS